MSEKNITCGHCSLLMAFEEAQQHDCIYEKFGDWFINVSDCTFSIVKQIVAQDKSKTFEYPTWGTEENVPEEIRKAIYEDIEQEGAINISGWYQIKNLSIHKYVKQQVLKCKNH